MSSRLIDRVRNAQQNTSGDGSGPDDFARIKTELHKELVASLDFEQVRKTPRDELKARLRRSLSETIQNRQLPLNRAERDRLADEILDEITGLGPLEPLLEDSTITDILINGHDTVFVERNGRLERAACRFNSPEHLMQIIDRIVSQVGRRIDESNPMVDARLADGSRFTEATDPALRAAELLASATAAWVEALAEYAATLELQPGDWDALNGSMRVSSLLGQPADALVWARRLLDTTEIESSFWRRQLERADLSAPDERGFRELMQNAADLQVATHLAAASILKSLDQPSDALAHMDRVLELDPDLREAWSRRAQLLMAIGEYSTAQESLDQFLRRSPDFDDPAVRLAYALLSECEAAITEAASR